LMALAAHARVPTCAAQSLWRATMKLPCRRFLHLAASAARCRPCRGSRGRKAIPRGQCLLDGHGWKVSGSEAYTSVGARCAIITSSSRWIRLSWFNKLPLCLSAVRPHTSKAIGLQLEVAASSVNTVSVDVLSRFMIFSCVHKLIHRRAARLAHDQALAHDQQASGPATRLIRSPRRRAA
jgi:hypothetical protein